MGVFKTPGTWVTGYYYCSAHTAGVLQNAPTSGGATRPTCFFIQFHFPRSALQKYKIIKKGWQAECKIL